jgi:hypothetical protein
MKLALAAVLVAACTAPSAQGIPGDTSVDDPVAPPDETGDGKSDEPPQPITYGGGVVMDAPTIVHVYWGSYWTTDAGQQARVVLDAFPGAVGTTAWWQITAQYAANDKLPGAPSVGAPVVIDTSEPPARIKETSLKTVLASALSDGTLAWDAETMYVVITAPGAKPPKDECGHHFYFSTDIGGTKRKVIYAFVPSFDDDSCAGGATVNGLGLDSMTVTLSHEYAEAATDPYLDAWGDGGNEIADQCDNGFSAPWAGGPYAVQELWSNASSACVQQ